MDKQNLAQYKYFNNLVGKDDMVKDIASIYIQRLGRYELTPEIHLGCGETMELEMHLIALCLTDYLLEMKKMMEQQAGNLQETKAGDTGGSDRHRVSKYADQNSIKIFDIAPGVCKEGYELEVNYFKKKRGGVGTVRRTGYEMATHTRRGHYRKYSDGKTVYVHSSVIHKEKYNGIQSAHRINEAGENNIMGSGGSCWRSRRRKWRELFFALSFPCILWYDIRVAERKVARWRY